MKWPVRGVLLYLTESLQSTGNDIGETIQLRRSISSKRRSDGIVEFTIPRFSA